MRPIENGNFCTDRELSPNYSNTFEIIKAWGTGKSCAGDGTLCYIREENLIAEYHIRYGHRGGIVTYQGFEPSCLLARSTTDKTLCLGF